MEAQSYYKKLTLTFVVRESANGRSTTNSKRFSISTPRDLDFFRKESSRILYYNEGENIIQSTLIRFVGRVNGTNERIATRRASYIRN